jgi:ribonuclease VapC
VSSGVLDASALLAYVNDEPGTERVADLLPGAAISAVNFSEVVAKLAERGVSESEIHELLDDVGLEVFEFNLALAYDAGLLRPLTRRAGLSLSDRACLALARQVGLSAWTTDRAWSSLQLGISIEVLR